MPGPQKPDPDRKLVVEAQGIVGEIRAGAGRQFRLTFAQAVKVVVTALKQSSEQHKA